MDTFFEQIIVRKPSNAERIVKILTIVFGVLACLIMLTISFLRLLGAISFIFLPLSFGVAVFLYFTVRNMYIEYEYCITNDCFDIDRIIGKRKRERIVSLNCSDFEEFGIYNESVEQMLKNREFGGRSFAANSDADELYYAISRHARLGSVLIIIQPNDKIKSALKKFVPRQVQKDVLGGFGHTED